MGGIDHGFSKVPTVLTGPVLADQSGFEQRPWVAFYENLRAYQANRADTINNLAFYLGDQFVVTLFSFNTSKKELNILQHVTYRLTDDGSLTAENVETSDLPAFKGQTKLTFLGKKIVD